MEDGGFGTKKAALQTLISSPQNLRKWIYSTMLPLILLTVS